MLHVVPDVWGTLLERDLRFVQRCPTRNLVNCDTPFVHGRMESPNTSSQTIELNPSCLGQAHPNRPGTGPWYKNTESGKIFTVLRISFMVIQAEMRMPSPARLFKRFRAAGTKESLDLILSW